MGRVTFLPLFLALILVLFNVCWRGGYREGGDKQDRRPPGFMNWISSKIGLPRGVNPRRFRMGPRWQRSECKDCNVLAERRRDTILRCRIEWGETSVILIRIRKECEESKRSSLPLQTQLRD